MTSAVMSVSMDGNECRVQKLEHAPGEPSVKKPKFSFIPAGTFASRPLPGWVIKDVLPKAELAVIYGSSSAGKSFMLLDMMGAIARGETWRGIAVKQRRVIYFCAEGSDRFPARLRAYSQRHGVDLNAIPLTVVPEPPNLLRQDDKDIASQVSAYGGADIIVFDTLAQCTPGGNENSSESIGKALEHCKRLHRASGAMIILVAHSGKDSSKGVRGWSGIRGAADVQIEIVCNGTQRAIRIDKQKDGEAGGELGFRLDVVMVGPNEDGEDTTSCVVEHLTAIPKAEQKKEPRSTKQRLVLRIAKELLELSKDGVSESDLIEACVSQISRNEYGQCDNRRRDLTRALNALVAANLIDTSTGYVNLK